MTPINSKHYIAFISYSSVDEKWANWLWNKLEHFYIPSVLQKEQPTIPKHLRPVFWYKKDLSGTQLQNTLYHELDDSQYLIVICSPASAKSEWVNKEVSRFIELGRIDRIIPLIVAGTPHSTNADDECFPAALRALPSEQELRGIDIRRIEGKEHALVDVVATILNVRFNELWRRHERRRKKIISYLSASILLLLLVGLGIFSYKRPHVEYYADYVDKWGIPEGVCQLKKEEVLHRERSYRFTYYRIPFGEPNALHWRLKEVANVNFRGIPEEHYTSVEYHINRHAIMQMEYSVQTGQVMRINHLDEEKKILLRYDYSMYNDIPATIVDFRAASQEVGSVFLGANTTTKSFRNSEQNRSQIKRYVYERDANGYIIQVTYHSNNDDNFANSIVCDADGIAGMRYTLDTLGRIIHTTYIGQTGELTSTPKGVAGKKYSYSPNGALLGCYCLDINGDYILNENYWAFCIDSVDQYGNAVSRKHFDEQGRPCYIKSGFSSFKALYDTHGNCIETRFFDDNDNPCMDKNGVAKYRNQYDLYGNCIEVVYYDTVGNVCVSIDSVAKICWQYDSQRNKIEYSTYDVDDKPVANEYGIAKSSWKYNLRKHTKELTYYDEDGNLYIDEYGVAKIRRIYDSRGNLIEISNYNSDGNSCVDEDGIAKYCWKYDSHGNVIERSYFGTDGNPCTDTEGIHQYRWKHDVRGNCIERTTHNVYGEFYVDIKGVAKTCWKHDVRGNIIETAFYDADENLVGQIAKYRGKYDMRGNYIEHSCYDNNDSLCRDLDGVACYRLNYDSHGNLIEMMNYGIDGNHCHDIYGVAKYVYKYDSHRNKTERIHYDIYGRNCYNSDGVAKYTWKYDSRRNKIEEICYDTHDRPCVNSDGYAKTIWEYDRYGNTLSERYYDLEGNEVVLLNNDI